MIRIEGLSFQYPGSDFRLQVPRFEVQAGEKVALIGPSGSGKTTLLNLAAGILIAGQGRIGVDGVRVDALADNARRGFRSTHIGFVFQDFELIDYLSVQDNILHPCRISNALQLDRSVRERARDLARRMGIDEHWRRYPAALSQGEKQRAAICRALLSRPRVILADEATGNLDPDNKQHILDLLFGAVDAEGATLLAVTHDHELLPRFDRVVDFAQFRHQAV